MSKKKFLLALLFLLSSVAVTAAQTRTDNPSAAIERGNRRFAKEDYEAALREYRSVPSSAGETYAQALYNIGISYYELWRTDEATDFYRRAIVARHGHYPRASYALGVAFEDQKQLAEAKEAYQQAIVESSGEYAAAHYRLGLLIAGEGEYQAAAESFRKALKHPGLHVPASHNNLGVMLARLGSLKDAQHEFEIALGQTGGGFDDAAYNLKLCRSLLTAAAPKQAAFRVSEVIAAQTR
ncbi:MAG: tetratricopeptide repeat protein [Pyrinomonadaceae bacterium]